MRKIILVVLVLLAAMSVFPDIQLDQPVIQQIEKVKIVAARINFIEKNIVVTFSMVDASGITVKRGTFNIRNWVDDGGVAHNDYDALMRQNASSRMTLARNLKKRIYQMMATQFQGSVTAD